MTQILKWLMMAGTVALLVVLAYALLTMQDRRTVGQKIGDAMDQLPHGLEQAERELEDRTPGQHLGDAIKDAGDSVKAHTQPTY